MSADLATNEAEQASGASDATEAVVATDAPVAPKTKTTDAAQAPEDQEAPEPPESAKGASTPEADDTAEAPSAEPEQGNWIVTPWWDLAFIVASPLAIVPILLILSGEWFRADQVSLAVISFASLGHHLPGFLRAYGDRSIFRRFRWRFLLAPPLMFAAALLFSPPRSLAMALGLTWYHLHGLDLLLLGWAVWHWSMQTYGIMRLYDLRRGTGDLRTVRLDRGLCLAVFIAGVVFSDTRMASLADVMWQAGLPLFGRGWLIAARWLVGGLGLSMLAVYVADLVARWRRGEPLGWNKLMLATSTGLLFWYTGRLATDLLVGLAMFELLHATQYVALVWITNRRRQERIGEDFGPLGRLFRPRWSMLAVYLGLVAGYGSLRLLAGDSAGLVFLSPGGDAHQWLMALFVTSTMMHFYYNGFTWKLSDQSIQHHLVDDATQTAQDAPSVSVWRHATKWALAGGVAAALLLSERSSATNQHDAKRIESLVALTPRVPECQSLAIRTALAQGDHYWAEEHARETLALRPRSHVAMVDLADALLAVEKAENPNQQAGTRIEKQYGSGGTSRKKKEQRIDEIRRLLQEAVQIEPRLWHYHVKLAHAYEQFGDAGRAETAFREAVRLQPDLERSHLELARFFLRQDRGREAFEQAEWLLDHYRKSWRSKLAWGMALGAVGRHQEAAVWLEQALEHDDSAEIYYQLGLAQLNSGKPAEAIPPLFEAVRRRADHVDALLQLGNALYLLEKWPAAIDAYRRCRRLQPNRVELLVNLGTALAQSDQTDEAEEIYREALALKPNSPRLHYNLGLLLLETGQFPQGQEHLRRAKQLGFVVPKPRL